MRIKCNLPLKFSFRDALFFFFLPHKLNLFLFEGLHVHFRECTICMNVWKSKLRQPKKKFLKNPILILVDGWIQPLYMKRVKFQRTFENHAKILSCM